MIEITDALAIAQDQPETTYRALERLVDRTVGVRLFTLMEIDRDRDVARRSYTNMPDIYPVQGEKPLMRNRWFETVDGRHEIFVANTLEEIAEVFADHELIRSVGCESCLNLPIVIRGRLRGTLNCLHGAGHYTPDRVVAARSLKPAGALAFLMAETIRREGGANG
ncbi:MAG: GAF domain-containing protein [Rhodobacter sp.]|nr:GAF domain-containing protein [Rhodobacter sp.]